MNKIIGALTGIGLVVVVKYAYEFGKNEGKKELVLRIIHQESDKEFEESIELFRKARSEARK